MLRPALFLASILLACFALAACDAAGPERSDPDPPRTLTAQEEALVEADNHFGLKLFRAISREEPGANVFISPLSVSMALGMTLNGAEGETRAAMEETLELAGLSQAEINASYRSLIDLLTGLDPAVTFRIANAIWYRETFEVEEPFLDTNREYFDAEVAALDFSSPGAPGVINAWVREETEGRIEEIVEGPIDPLTMMYLINAIYFKGDWSQPFDPGKTQEDTFTLPGGSETTVEMMTLENPTLAYYRDGDLTAVDLPYGDSLFTMTIVLPHEGTPVDTLAARLDAARWAEITGKLHPRRLARLQMPKFTLEYEKTLNEVLKALGMEVAFVPGAADFSGINEELGQRHELYISEVKHKAFIEVDEEGTEAAAATSVEVSIVSMPPAVRIDRPFVFALRENHSGTILFIGKVTNP